MDSAEDLAQAAWVRGWQKINQLRDESTVASWVNTIALNYQRRGGQDAARYQELPDLCGATGIDLAPLDAARLIMLCRVRDRSLFEGKLKGMTTNEIAETQGVSPTAIRIRFLRARRAVLATAERRAAELRETFRNA